MSHVLTAACHTCEALGPMLRRSAGGVMLTARRSAAGANASWWSFLIEHQGHDLRLLSEGYHPEVPVDGWFPRLVHGPPESGHMIDQPVACPNCRSTSTTWKTVNQGERRFAFCRSCANVWGDAVQREILAATLTGRPFRPSALLDIADPTTP